MIDRDSPVTEDELHAYIDGELPADRMQAVSAWLADHPDQAATVASWRAQAERIRARYGAVLEEAVPERLKLDQIIRSDRANGRSWKAFAAAAAVAAFLVGGASGWFAHGASVGTRTSSFAVASEALDAYKLYVVEVRHPVEVPGTERQHMTQWLSKRLGEDLRVPDLQSIGLKLVGGRLLPGPTGAAAFYMYEGASGERFTIYCAKASVPESALRYTSAERAAAFYWVDDKVAYVVSGPADREKLEKVTKAAYEQMEKSGAKKS
ncbi:MAG TPA: anti-sigma factor [Pseudolabrys sp.]|jgi:anti-sigma factor RsiW|nr:anti-sigma factor [Pseudolabrys sp.]